MRLFLGAILLLFGCGGWLIAQEQPAPAAAPPDAAVDPATEPAVRAVSKVLPAVVNINTERVVRRTLQDPYDELFYEFFGGAMRPPRAIAQKVQSLGSGFIIDPAGYIVTNEHVVERAADLKIQVTTTDGKTYEAKYLTGDADADLALIKIESPQPLPFVSLEDLSPNLLGQSLLVLGNPLGYGSSVSRGILSALKRDITINDFEFKDLLQTDAAINPGNSGGPLIDLQGKLVGVASVKMAFTPQGVPTQGISFAIPASFVRTKVAEFRATADGKLAKGGPQGAVSAARRFFGLQLQDLTPELSESFGYDPGRGVLITDVERGSPAGDAGFRRGLLILKIGRHDVNSTADVEKLLSRATAGTVVDFVVGVTRRVRGQVQQRIENVSLTAR
jgi:serine protease Do